MVWRETGIMDERLGFVADCLAGEETMSELCAAYGISRKTGYSLVNSSLPWRVQVSADARKLLDLCERYKKLGAYKEPKSVFLVSVADGELRVKFKTTTIGIPIL